MRIRSIRILSQTFSFLLFALSTHPAEAQIERFDFKPAKVPTGTVFFYDKSNIDGTNASRIAVYVAAQDRLESFKWHEGGGAATLVTADLDWQTFTVRRFESLRLLADGTRQTQAVLEKIPGKPQVSVAAGPYQATIEIENWPWQSYDFDFAGLSIILPHLKKPKKPFTVGISDVVRGQDGPSFADKGPVTLRYLGRDQVGGTRCRQYAIDGEGLENRGGRLWVDARHGHLVRYEIDLPDEPGFESGRLDLVERRGMSAEAWETFKAAKLAAE
jgi:hypothetical protein